MARSNTTFTKETAAKTAPRSKGKRTLFLEAIAKEAKGGEQGFYELVVRRAIDPSDPASSVLMKEILSRLYPSSKPTLPIVNFDFPYEASAVEKVNALELAVSDGTIPADVAKVMVDIIRSSIEIEKMTELMERIERIEAALNEPKSS